MNVLFYLSELDLEPKQYFLGKHSLNLAFRRFPHLQRFKNFRFQICFAVNGHMDILQAWKGSGRNYHLDRFISAWYRVMERELETLIALDRLQNIDVNIELLSDHPPLLNSEMDDVIHHLVNPLRRLRSEKCNIKTQ